MKSVAIEKSLERGWRHLAWPEQAQLDRWPAVASDIRLAQGTTRARAEFEVFCRLFQALEPE